MFNAKIATDMAIYLLQKADGPNPQSYLKILHMMYLAERENIRLHAEHMCGDDRFSTPDGPILSKTLDLIEGRLPLPLWQEYIYSEAGETIALKEPATQGYRLLSRADKQILNDVWEAHKSKTWQEMRDWMKANCSEWDKRADIEGFPNRIAIGLDTLLNAFGLSEEKQAAVIIHFENGAKLESLHARW